MTLRIESVSDEHGTTIRLIGRMQAQHVEELRAQIGASGARVVLDLEDLSLVDIDAVRRSTVLPVTLGEEDPVPDSLTDEVMWLVANRKFDGYRALVAAAPARVDRFPLLPYAATALGVGEGDSVRAVPLAPRDR